eukprot:705930-Amphidinium_carterae.1
MLPSLTKASRWYLNKKDNALNCLSCTMAVRKGLSVLSCIRNSEGLGANKLRAGEPAKVLLIYTKVVALTKHAWRRGKS